MSTSFRTCVFGSPAAPRRPGQKEKEEPLPPPGRAVQNRGEQSQADCISWHNFESANNRLPLNEIDAKGKALLSWRVQILPYIEELALYNQFKLDEPWDSDNNKKLIDKMPKLFAPLRVKADSGMTFYQSFTGSNGVLDPTKKYSLGTIPDGTSNTFMVAESAKPVIWTKPDDLVYDGKKLPELGGMFDGKFHAAFLDGHVVRFKKEIDKETLGRLIDPADGNTIDVDSAEDKNKD